MGQTEIMSEGVPQGKKKKQTSDDDDDDRKKKVEIHIVCCTIM